MPTPSSRRLAWIGATLVALVGLVTVRLGTPDPAPADAPADQFSATRAIAVLHRFSLDAPHPLATPAHDVVRDRVAAELTALGYAVDAQRAVACNRALRCGEVTNLIARLPGERAGGPAIAIAAHYDSVPAGPGASDDGTGVATILEVARAIRGQTFRHPIELLLTDGEEPGLLGAEAFVADPARARDTAFVINIEARGTTGTPVLFETSVDQRWLAPVIAGALPRPMTSSLFAGVYELMPNSTDLSVFKRAHRAGINFAYIGGPNNYHTPADSFADVDAGCVQRRGDQVLAMVRAFGDAELGAPAAAPAVWFDVAGTFVVWWPASFTLPIIVVALALLVVAAIRAQRRGALALGGIAIGAATMLGALVVAVVLGLALTHVLGASAARPTFVTSPTAMLAAGWALGLAAALAAGGVARRWASFDAVLIGHALVWNALAIAVSRALPGGAYLFVVPGAVMAIAAVARGGELFTSIAGLVAAALVWLPFVLIGHDALGDGIVAVVPLMIALLASTFSPLAVGLGRRAGAACLIIGVIAAVIARLGAPPPRHLVIDYVSDADAGETRWQAWWLPAEVRAAASWGDAPRALTPWFGADALAFTAPAPALGLAPPTASATAVPNADGTVTVTFAVASARAANRIMIAWHSAAEVVAIRVAGAPPMSPPFDQPWIAAGWHDFEIAGPNAQLDVVLRGAPGGEAYVSDWTYGLPVAGTVLAAARDHAGVVPAHDGDTARVQRRLTW